MGKKRKKNDREISSFFGLFRVSRGDCLP